jgi:SAM-dependent methyltransferase
VTDSAGRDAETLDARLARLERERAAADASYNDALSALDRSIAPRPEFPHPPPAYDPSKLAELNAGFELLPDGPPAVGGSIKGRLRAFVWRLIGPPLDRQRHFNAVLVDHLNRNVKAHEEAERAMATSIALIREQTDHLIRFQAHLIQYLQTITLYVDTRDRSAAAGGEIVNAALSAITDEWLKRWESLGAREARLTSRADAVLASLADLRATSALAQQTAVSLKREVERAVAAITSAPVHDGGGHGDGGQVAPAAAAARVADLDAFKYLGFENAFRGDPAEIRRRLEAYLPLFAGRHDVLDLGCGRGEFLDLLRSQGISGRGIDINAAMVEETRARGLSADVADALSYLRAQGDASVGGVFAAQVVEHLEPAYLAALLEEAARVICPGGIIVLETINPTSWVAFFESYIRDLTHVRPLHPETLQFLLRVSGFGDVQIRFSSPVDPLARLQTLSPPAASADDALADLVATLNDNTARLNARLFGDQDYAVVGMKG